MVKILIIHYHLNPGGVTRIIQSQIRSLKMIIPDTQITLLCGACGEPEYYEELGVKLIVDERFNYLSGTDFQDNLPDHLASCILPLISKSDIIHAHNLNLGKNPALTIAANKLVKDGYKVFNHCHDFAEDRPRNWDYLHEVIEGKYKMSLNDVLYPALDNYRLGVLNLRDLRRLEEYRIPQERSYLLPNPVEIPSEEMSGFASARDNITTQLSLDAEKLIVTYPVRVIRRKNIGEFILLATLFAHKASWLVTQDPLNPAEVKFYEKWVEFCSTESISVLFEAGKKVNFPELIHASDFCITTSVQEGFGMVFMEPWLMGTPVIGRNIDYIIDDLSSSGIVFPRLYDKLSVSDGEDFKDLGMEEQMEIIDRVNRNDTDRGIILDNNPVLDKLFDPVPESTIMMNQEVIRAKYSIKNYGEKLNEIYRSYSE